MSKTKSNAFKNIIVLFVVALVSVSILAVLNQITLEPIAKAEADATAAVYKAVYADAADFEEIEKYGENSSYKPEDDSIVINGVLNAKSSSGEILGYVFDVTSKNGYGGDVQIAVGITKKGEITAFKVISASETPGLGAKAMEEEYASQFSGLKADEVKFVKGSSANRDNNEIDAISGATITTTATTNAVNEAIKLFNAELKGE